MNDLILITGSSGFIGRHATKYFRKKGFDVIGCSRTYYGDGDQRQCDLSNVDEVKDLFKFLKPKYILHLAGNSSPKADGYDTLMANVIGTHNLAKYCNDNARIIFASTVLVYGKGSIHYSHEEADLPKPISIYGASKAAAEQTLGVFARQGKIGLVNFRLPAVVGSDLTHGMLVDFLRKVRNENALRPIGEFPGPTKPYLHIDDLLSAFELGLTMPEGTYNVSPSELVNVDEIAKTVLKELQIDIPVEWGTCPTWKGDIDYINVSSRKIKNQGWKNEYSSREAIVQAIK
jgi:UDP-glucose 4-epimerase